MYRIWQEVGGRMVYKQLMIVGSTAIQAITTFCDTHSPEAGRYGVQKDGRHGCDIYLFDVQPQESYKIEPVN